MVRRSALTKSYVVTQQDRLSLKLIFSVDIIAKRSDKKINCLLF
jgi:hypothetical protein